MIYYLAIICSILFLTFIILLVKKNKLEEKYSILWIIFSILIVVLSLNRNILEKASNLLGIYYAPAALFLIGFIFCIIYIIHLSVVITKQNKAIIKLTQKLAILQESYISKEKIK